MAMARETKRSCSDEGESSNRALQTDSSHTSGTASRSVPSELQLLLGPSDNLADTDDEDVDPSFELESSILSDTDHMVDSFCEEWVTSLSWENRASLGIFLSFQLSSVMKKGTG